MLLLLPRRAERLVRRIEIACVDLRKAVDLNRAIIFDWGWRRNGKGSTWRRRIWCCFRFSRRCLRRILTSRGTFQASSTKERLGRLEIDRLGLVIVLFPGHPWEAAVRPPSPLALGCLQLIVTHFQKLVLAHLIAAALIVGLHRLPRDHIDELLPEAVAGLLIDLAKRNARSRPRPDTRRRDRKPRRASKSPSNAHAWPRRYSLHNETPGQRLKWLFGLAFLSPVGTTEDENLLSSGDVLAGVAAERTVDPAVVPQCNILGCPSGRAPTEASHRAFY
jgi:hypothetical protein